MGTDEYDGVEREVKDFVEQNTEETDIFSGIQDYRQAVEEEFGLQSKNGMDAITAADRLLKQAVPGAIATLSSIMMHGKKDSDRNKASETILKYYAASERNGTTDAMSDLLRDVVVQDD